VSLPASSSFLHSTQRDDRRRRLLAEEISGWGNKSAASLSSDANSLVSKSEHYGDGSFLDEQIRLIELVPLRLPIITLWLAVGMALIAGLEFLHGWQARLSTDMPGGGFPAFDLSSSGSLSSWFSSLLLLAAAVSAVLVYTIRRHKTDDYHGRYRIWFWAALCWFLWATDVAANLHESLKQLMIQTTATRLWGDGTLWWFIPAALLFGALGSRLILDMLPCGLAVFTFLLAAAGYFVAAGMELGVWTIEDAARAVMIRSGAAMYGHLMLLLSMVLNARYVLLDAAGLVPHRQANEESAQAIAQNSAATAGAQWTRVDSPSGTPQPVLRRASTAAPIGASAGSPPAFGSSQPPAPVTRKLTKQEKKALRDKLLQARMERERRQQQGW
jgi:hypothetical protein